MLRSLALLAGLSALCSLAAAESPRHMFLDPGMLQTAERVTLHVNPPQAGEIVIRADQPWEQRMISLFLTVLDEGSKLRMWYICRDEDNHPNVAYAESEDGVHWRKPKLGIVDYQGSKDNNLVGLTSLEGSVYRDPQGKPNERYIYVTHLSKKGIVRFTSPDGLRWKRDPQPLLPFRADTQNVTLYDPQLGKYVLYLRGWDVKGRWEDRLRKVVRLTLDNLATPAPIRPSGNGDSPHDPALPRIVDEIPTVFRADDRDPPNCDVYNISATLYPPDPRWYLGFPSFLLREASVSDGRLEVQFIASRDGINWQRYDRAPYAVPGLAGSEDANVVFMGTGLAIRGDEMWQYGMGLRSRHGKMAASERHADGSIRRYVQRLDGFVSADFDAQGGHCTTAPVRVTEPRLLLNVDTGALGGLRVALLDAQGKALPGFSADDCLPLHANATGAAVRWKERAELTGLVGQEVRLAFSGSRTRLFSFTFAAAPGMSSAERP